MKCIFFVIVFVYISYRAVYGVKHKEVVTLEVESLNYGEDGYIKAGVRKTISCKGSIKNQKVEWYDPLGKIVKRKHNNDNQIFVQEHFVRSLHSSVRTPALVLIFDSVAVVDSGVWECRSGDLKHKIPLCVIEPSEFINTPTVVTTDLGRSITLTCEARGAPEPRIVWSRNGELITDDDKSTKYKIMTKYNSQGFEGLLTVMNVEPEDSGIFTCDAVQEHTSLETCANAESLNITLNVNYGPIFDTDNETVNQVFGKYNESVDLVCAAKAFPTPTYRWFQVLEDDVLSEFSEKQIIVSENGSDATLTLIANASTFRQKYICNASNRYGNAYSYFTVLKLEKPRQPNGITATNSTHEQIEFNVTWSDDIVSFPVDNIDIQYFEKQPGSGTPREVHWKRAKKFITEPHKNYFKLEEIYVTLPNLEEDTEYWVRLRVKNEAGESPWSIPILANTVEQEEVTERITDEETLDAEDMTFAIFFAAGVLVFGAVCTFVLRKL